MLTTAEIQKGESIGDVLNRLHITTNHKFKNIEQIKIDFTSEEMVSVEVIKKNGNNERP